MMMNNITMANMPDMQAAWAYAEYQKESALIHDKTEAELHKAAVKADISVKSEEHLLRLREDIKIEASCLSETFALAEDGRVERRQEFLLKKPHAYDSANFKILDAKALYKAVEDIPFALYLKIKTAGDKEGEIFLNIRNCSGNYFAKKFREVGARLKLKRGEKNDRYCDFILIVSNVAESCIIPPHHGFYHIDNALYYAGKSTLTVKEVLNYAE